MDTESSDSRVPVGDDLSREIRDKVAEAGVLQRRLNEAAVHARQVVDLLRPSLDEIAAYLHRETGLDVVAGHTLPKSLKEPLQDGHDQRVTVETREVSIPTVPPTAMIGGYQVQVSLNRSLEIVAFWGIGDCSCEDKSHCWSEQFSGHFGESDMVAAANLASKALLASRHEAAEHLLKVLREVT
jgi:hypothetical protein